MSFLGRLFGKPSTDAPLGAHAYAEHYAAAVRRAHPGTTVAVHPGATAAQTRVEWTTPAGWNSTQFFGNFHARYLQRPADLPDLLAEQLAEAEAIGSQSHDVVWRDTLLPMLKTTSWRETSAAQRKAAGAPEEAGIVDRPLVGELIVTCVADTAQSMAFVTRADLERQAIDEETLHSTALANLERRLPELRIEGGGGRFAARLDRNYDASMALLLDRWRDRVPIEGDLVLALPARDELLMCPAADAAIVASLAPMAADIAARSAYGLTAQLFTWRGGALVPMPG